MARRIEVTVDRDGEEINGWIDLSSSLDKAAMQKAFDEEIAPTEALDEFLTELFARQGEDN